MFRFTTLQAPSGGDVVGAGGFRTFRSADRTLLTYRVTTDAGSVITNVSGVKLYCWFEIFCPYVHKTGFGRPKMLTSTSSGAEIVESSQTQEAGEDGNGNRRVFGADIEAGSYFRLTWEGLSTATPGVKVYVTVTDDVGTIGSIEDPPRDDSDPDLEDAVDEPVDTGSYEPVTMTWEGDRTLDPLGLGAYASSLPAGITYTVSGGYGVFTNVSSTSVLTFTYIFFVQGGSWDLLGSRDGEVIPPGNRVVGVGDLAPGQSMSFLTSAPATTKSYCLMTFTRLPYAKIYTGNVPLVAW